MRHKGPWGEPEGRAEPPPRGPSRRERGTAGYYIPSRFILLCRVVGFNPSREATPFSPYTLPPDASKAASIRSRSRFRTFAFRESLVTAAGTGLASPSPAKLARAAAFFSSRTFPSLRKPRKTVSPSRRYSVS